MFDDTLIKAIKMKKLSVLIITLSSLNFCLAQDNNIVEIMDEMRLDWDAKVQFIDSFEDLKNLCRNRNFRVALVDRLVQIHHYDTTLYNTVIAKYSENDDQEAKATLNDIETLEKDYTTGAFLDFIHDECNDFNFVKYSYGIGGEMYDDKKNRVEIELKKYVSAITWQIDIIDEHAHHLNL